MHQHSASPPKTARSHQRAHLRGRSCKRNRSPNTTTTTVVPASRSYDTAGRVIATELGQYTYDSAGRITSLTQQLYKPSNTTASSTGITATTAVYTIGYDSLGRVESFSRAAGTGAANTAPLSAQSAIFTYDANGNRLTSIQTTGSGSTAQNTQRTFSVDPTSDRLLGFAQTLTTGTATGGTTANVTYQYDANGALLKDGLRSYEFDAANRLAGATTGAGIDAPTTRYVHNALGQRLFKTEPLFAPVASGSNPNDPGVMAALISFFTSLWGGSSTTAAPTAAEKLGFQYFYDEDGSLLYELGTGGANSTGSAHYVHLPTPSGPMPIAFYNGSKHYAVHTDHLNTPRRLTNSSKQVAWQWAFSAFGDEQPTTGAKRYVDPTVTPNAGSTTIADVTFNLRYPGQYFDKESGLNYNYFRSYDAKTGRYTQSDPIGLDGGWNRFGYVDGNPMSFTDPLGLCQCDNIFNQARELNNDPRYQYSSPSRPGPNKNKCNFFVDDVLQHTDVAPSRNIFSMPISAGTWADPNAKIPNFPVVTSPRPGDIVAIAANYSDASGHVAIVGIPGVSTIGTGPRGSGTSGWPWDRSKQPQGTPVFRRCTCQ
jgi:RHS repeat-associated protein